MSQKTKIIAEIGINHNGKESVARELILQAKKAGADFVKFQSFNPELLVTKKMTLANYQKIKEKNFKKMIEMLKKFHLDEKTQKRLQKFSQKNKIGFLSSPFEEKSLEFLVKKLKIGIIKIPSGEITNYPFLKKIGKTKKKIILSTGMSNLDEVKNAVQVLFSSGIKKKDLTILHCNSSYPTNIKDLNLNVLKTLSNKFKASVGFSDHSKSLDAPIVAVSLGAKIIEKHFTLNCNQSGPDHSSSLNPNEFAKMVKKIRETEKMLGSKVKKVTKSEKKNLVFARKSIVAKKTIKKGEKFSEQNITVKRPGSGMSPYLWNKIIGKKAKKNFSYDDLIN